MSTKRLSLSCLLAVGFFTAVGCTVKTENGSNDAGTAGGSGGTGGTGGTAGASGGGSGGDTDAGPDAGSAGNAGSGGSAGSAGSGGTSGAGGTAGRGGAGGSAGGAIDAGGKAGGGGVDGGSIDGTPPVDGGGIADQGVPGEAGSDPCSGADPGNEDRDHATPIPMGSDYAGCLQTSTDIDFYEFTTPDMPAAGGVVVVSFTEVTGGGVGSTAYAATDNGAIQGNNTVGTGFFYWFAAVPSAKYRLEVKPYLGGTAAIAYKLKAAYSPVNDAYEPNDLRTQGTPITVGTPVNGYLFAGYANSTGLAANAWEDWYKVSMAAGSTTIALADLASDINGAVTLYDNLGVQVATANQAAAGTTVVLTKTGIASADYYVKVTPYYNPTPKGNGAVPGVYTTQPYTLTVAQP